MFPSDSPQGTVRVSGKQNCLVLGPVIKCFVIPPNSKIKANCAPVVRKNHVFDAAGHKIATLSRHTTCLAYGGCARGTNGGQNCTVLTSSNFIVD